MSEKTYFGCMDFRNAKYQGLIRDHLLQGIGIVLDSEYMLTLTNWKNQIPNGPTLTIFPNRSYLYGRFKNRKLNGICCYQASTGEAYYFNFADGYSEAIAFVQNSSILEIDNRKGAQRVKSIIKEPQITDKWQIISKIIKADVTEEYQDYKAFVQSNFLREFKDVIEVSESAGLTFVGFKNTLSLGAKYDKNNQVRQIGNFQEFPRNIEFGKRFTTTSATDIKVQQGKFTIPEQIHQYKNDKRSVEATKCTQNYFKKGTNFQNNFLKLTTFIQLSQYFRDVRILIEQLKEFQFGQRILEKPTDQSSKKQDAFNKHYDLEEVRRDIFSKVNKKAKLTNRSPTRRQLEQSPRNNSGEKYDYLRQIREPQAVQPFKRSKEKYLYTKQLSGTALHRHPQLQYNHRYQPMIPDVSQFDRNIEALYQNAAVNQKLSYQLQQQRLIQMRMQEIRRDQAIKRSYNELLNVSPVAALYHPASDRKMSKSPLKIYEYANNQKKNYEPQEYKYQNYLKYKNRNKPEGQKVEPKPQPSSRTPEKSNKYERKVFAPNNVAQTFDVNAAERINLPGRYKKTFKYLQ